jgi:KDO2-lipid IV(A) lauroyltransferase
MKDAPVRHRIEYAFFRAARRGVLAMPFARVRRFGHGLGSLAHALIPGKRRLALRNLARVFPEKTDAERRAITRQAFRIFGATCCEMVAAERFTDADMEQRFHVTGWENIEQAAALGRGLCLTTGHFGRWEFSALYVAMRLGSLNTVIRPLDNPLVSADVERSRARFNNVLIPKQGAVRRMLSVLRAHGNLAVIVDQRVRESAGILVPFFGHPAWTSPVLAAVSLRSGAPVVPVFCTAEGAEDFRVRVLPAIHPEGEGKEAEASLTERYLEVIAREVRADPPQWLWMHRRWRGLPETTP